MAILQFEYEFDDSYFLMEPIEFVKSHWPLESKWALLPKSINTNLGAPNQK
jgi:transglutaminase/protease-like cytokinesis protein 3